MLKGVYLSVKKHLFVCFFFLVHIASELPPLCHTVGAPGLVSPTVSFPAFCFAGAVRPADSLYAWPYQCDAKRATSV